MENREQGQGWQQENFDAQLENEQASSDEEEEEFPLEQNGHPAASMHNNMYSRIHQEVQSRIPNIDFNTAEADEEIESVTIGGFWSSDDVNSTLNAQELQTRSDDANLATLQMTLINGSQNSCIKCSQPQSGCHGSHESGPSNSVLDSDIREFPEQKSVSFVQALSYLNSSDLSEQHISVVKSDWNDQGGLSNSNGAITVEEKNGGRRQNGCLDMHENMSVIEEESQLAAPHNNDLVSKEENMNGPHFECKENRISQKHGMVGKFLAMEKNVKLQEELTTEKTKLEANIDEANLDMVLESLPCNVALLDANIQSNFGKTASKNNNTDDEDNDPPLLDKLSSFALSEKNSVCETNQLLEQLSDPCIAEAKISGQKNVTASYSQTDSNYLIGTGKEKTRNENDTVYIDLRDMPQPFDLLNSGGTMYNQEFDDSSSSSEGEEWMKVRKDIKTGIHVKKSRKDEKRKNNCLMENKVHDRITRRSYERLMKSKSDVMLGMNENSTRGEICKTEQMVDDREKWTRIEGNAPFDLGPLEEKIRSWHQINDNNHNTVGNLLGDSNRDKINMLYSQPGANDKGISAAQPKDREMVSSSTGCDAKTVDEVRHMGTSTNWPGNESNNYGQSVTKVELTGEASMKNAKKIFEDSSLLGLEDVTLKRDVMRNARKSLLIVDEDSEPDVKSSDVGSSSNMITGNENMNCNIEELVDKVRISDNLLLIKANLSADSQNVEPRAMTSQDEISCNETRFVGRSQRAALCFRNDQGDAQGVLSKLDVHGEKNLQHAERPTHREALGRMLSLEEVEKDLLTDSSFRSDSRVSESVYETEMKTFSMAENERCSFTSNGEEMIESRTTLRGLLPQFGRQMFGTCLNGERERMQSEDEGEMCILISECQNMCTGEETPMIQRQERYVTASPKSKGGFETKRGIESTNFQRQENLKKGVNSKVDQKDMTTWDETSERNENMNDKTGYSKSKKKSKKKNRKSTELEEEVKEGKQNDGKNVSKNEMGLNITKNVANIEKETKKKPVCLVKETDKIQIEEKIRLLQEQVGMNNVIFDEKVSYTHAFKSLPNSTDDASKLMLKVPLQSPGICSKSCAKNSLSFEERSDAYIGLCTLFVSLLHGNKFKVCESLNIPFDVIALEQASIDSELQLVVGIVENEVQVQSSQPQKRSKPGKVKRNFYQAVTQYLNKTDLENVLLNLMDFDYTPRDISMISCPGTRKLSSYVSVSQDETAVARIFNLKPGIVWQRNEELDSQMSDNVCWMKGKQKRNESTCVMVENVTSMLPKTIASFMKTARNNSLDICGLRIAYVTKKDKTEEPTLVAAFRGPNVTTAQNGKSFTADTQELSTVKSIYMSCGSESPCDTVKEVTISGPNPIKTFNVSIADPLITYTIGRGRGEREVVNWFGRRTLSVADAELDVDNVKRNTSKAQFSSLPDKLDVLSRPSASASLLTISTNRVVLSMSNLVPTVFVSLALTMAESRGLYPVSAGKVSLNGEEASLMGLKVDGDEDSNLQNDCRNVKLSQSVSLIVFEGENSIYRAYGFVRSLFEKMNGKLPRDALTKDAVKQILNGLIKYEQVKQDRSIQEFFGLVQLNKKVIKVLEKMTAQNLSHLDNEVLNTMPSNWKLFVLPETPRICTAIFVGKPMVEIFPFILHEIFEECLEDPFCINAKATTERKYRQQERPVGEIIGLKCYAKLLKHMAHVCCPFVVGAKSWASSVENLQKGPVIVLVIRLLDTIKNMDEKCHKINRHVCKLLHSNELSCPPDCYYDAYTYTGLDTVFRVLLNMFKVDELMPDACPTWFKSTQWPVYLSNNSVIVKHIDPVLNLLANTHQVKRFRFGSEPESKSSTNPSNVKIISPLALNIPAELILGKQTSLTFAEFGIDCNFSKYIPKVLGILRRDSFDVVGLNFPSGYSPSFDTTPTMHVALKRQDAVFRLNQWLPELHSELHNKHSIKVSCGAKEAFDTITRNFQKTQSGGIFDDNNLATTEKLTFKNDDIFDCRDYRRIEWARDLNAKMSSATGAKHRLTADSNRGFVMPEVNIIIITNVMMRGTYLDEYISENAKFLGFWEHISSLGFKTIGARMTSLNQEQVDALLAELKLSATEHRIMEKRMPSSNGPIFALVLLKDFALSNFWKTVTKTLTEEECKIIEDNVLVPSNKSQVEVLLSSLFETVVPNSEMEIKKVSKLKE